MKGKDTVPPPARCDDDVVRVHIRAGGSVVLLWSWNHPFFFVFIFGNFFFFICIMRYQALFYFLGGCRSRSFLFLFPSAVLCSNSVYRVGWGGGWTKESKRETRTGSHLIKHSWKSTPLRRDRPTTSAHTYSSRSKSKQNNEFHSITTLVSI